MAQGGILGKRTRIGFATLPAASPTVWTKLLGVLNIDTPFSQVANDIDNTVYSDEMIETSMPGLSTPPEVKFSMVWDPNPVTDSPFATLRAALAARTTYRWRTEYPSQRDPAVNLFWGEEFDGYIKSIEKAAPSKDKMMVTITIRFSGNHEEDSAVGASQIG